ncbi:hypothetical protein Slin_5332 [Spirosoma linguale DSM 74]|uniref:Uncharacterized protein n=1 Tax=Spirosoma linguale (strain ATCC 33905 / DSM 74 / LMG 10896 / Claus 1) TaxID=504472 RepID=D2QEV7_SPILD|nr:hypothetical protein Slin_5332 [Spirosoma linguale DSM 74]
MDFFSSIKVTKSYGFGLSKIFFIKVHLREVTKSNGFELIYAQYY